MVGEDLDLREMQTVGDNQNGTATLKNSSTVSYQAACLLHSSAILKYLLREKREHMSTGRFVRQMHRIKFMVEEAWKESKCPAISG